MGNACQAHVAGRGQERGLREEAEEAKGGRRKVGGGCCLKMASPPEHWLALPTAWPAQGHWGHWILGRSQPGASSSSRAHQVGKVRHVGARVGVQVGRRHVGRGSGSVLMESAGLQA